jgi:hypothetical protein
MRGNQPMTQSRFGDLMPGTLFRCMPAAALLVAMGCLEAAAQSRAPGGGGPVGGGPTGTTPFSQTYRRPAISPYNQISNYAQNPQMFQNVYQQMVMPQLEQQQQMIQQMQQGRQLGRLQNQIQQIQRDTSARQIDEMIRPTGHRTTFQNYSHFYPQAR